MAPHSSTQESATGLAGQDLLIQIKKEYEADILIGIPTFNNATTIGHVLRSVQAGLARAFPDLKAVIVNIDTGSVDRTVSIVRTSVVRKIPIFIDRQRPGPALPPLPYAIPGLSAAHRSILDTAIDLDARACVVLEPDVVSIDSTWIEALVKPVIFRGFDLVSPLYSRHKFESTITNTILYPLTRALYGRRMRQPTNGTFCLSNRLARLYLEKTPEQKAAVSAGLDVGLLTKAIENEFRLGQVCLGPRISGHARRPDVSGLLPEVVGGAFGLLESDHRLWKGVRGSEPVPILGNGPAAEPEQAKPDVERMLALFRQGVRDLKEIWIKIIGAADFGVLEYLAFRPDGRFNITSTLWAQIVYDYALAYHERKLPLGHLLNSLTPLYLGKAASHMIEVRGKGEQETEEEIEKICLAFEERKDHLVANWRN